MRNINDLEPAGEDRNVGPAVADLRFRLRHEGAGQATGKEWMRRIRHIDDLGSSISITQVDISSGVLDANRDIQVGQRRDRRGIPGIADIEH